MSINVSAAATKAQVDIDGITASTAAANAYQTFSFSKTQTNATGGSFTFDGQTLSLAVSGSAPVAARGAESNGAKNIAITYSAGSASVTYDDTTDTINVAVTTATLTGTDLATALSGAGFTSNATGTSSGGVSTASVTSTALSGGRDAGSATLRITADEAGTTANGVDVVFTEVGTGSPNTATAAVDGNGDIQVSINGNVTYSAIASAINSLTDYTATITSATGDQTYASTLDTVPTTAALGGGLAATGGISQDVVFAVAGKSGSETFNFKAGTSLANFAMQ